MKLPTTFGSLIDLIFQILILTPFCNLKRYFVVSIYKKHNFFLTLGWDREFRNGNISNFFGRKDAPFWSLWTSYIWAIHFSFCQNFAFLDLWEKNIYSSYRLSDGIFLTNFGCQRKTFFFCFVSSDYYAKKMLPRFFISIKHGKKWYIRFSRPSWHDNTKKSVFGIGSYSLLFRKRNFFSKTLLPELLRDNFTFFSPKGMYMDDQIPKKGTYEFNIAIKPFNASYILN